MRLSLVRSLCLLVFTFFFFNDTATTEIYTLSLHDALPICFSKPSGMSESLLTVIESTSPRAIVSSLPPCSLSRSEEHTSELQSRSDLVCRLLLEKKKTPHMTEQIRV